jgi:hypothetical protein
MPVTLTAKFTGLLLVNQREKYHMGPLIRCGGRRSACARAGKRFTYHRSELMAPYGTFLADLPIADNSTTKGKQHT